MAAEEARDPRRTIPIAYITGILTLTALAFGVIILAGGAGDWRTLATVNDPLPQAMKTVVGESSGWLHMLVWLGLCGLVASFHGIIMAYARQIFALSRAGYLPAVFARLHPRFKTPDLATIAGGAIGIATIYSDTWLRRVAADIAPAFDSNEVIRDDFRPPRTLEHFLPVALPRGANQHHLNPLSH